jgi:hypothetical protein
MNGPIKVTRLCEYGTLTNFDEAVPVGLTAQLPCAHRRQVELGMTRKLGPSKKQDNAQATIRDIRNTRAIEFEHKP